MKLSYFINALEGYCITLEKGLIENPKDDYKLIRKNIQKLNEYISQNGDIDDILDAQGLIKEVLNR